MQSSGDAVVDDFENLNISDETASNNAVFQEDASRKLFVGGLSWMTTEDGLHNYFESLNLGVEKVIIMRDKMTGRSRGFGFLTLSTTEDVDKAVRANLHLDGRKVEAKRAIPKRDMDNHAKKIFVGGIPISLSNAEFRKYFEEFGKVLETQVMTDRESGRSRGFGFVNYEDEKIAEKVLKTVHTIHGKPVEVKRAEPKRVEQPQPVHIMHVNPVTPGAVYLPHGFPYQGGTVYHGPQAVYPAPVAYDPTYFVPTQGGLMYLPQPYDPLDSELYPGVHPHVHSHVPYMTDTYDKYETSHSRRPSVVPTDGRSKITVKPSPFSAFRLSEPRTERAFSAGFVGDTITVSSEGAVRPKLIPTVHLDPRKKRAGSQPTVATIKRRGSPPSIVSTRRTDLNWRNIPVARKSPTNNNDGTSYTTSGIHKYFQ